VTAVFSFVKTLNFLLWIGAVLLIIAIVMFLLRTIAGRER
jgi:uncharacterized protein involved in cysteine biosynthesis